MSEGILLVLVAFLGFGFGFSFGHSSMQTDAIEKKVICAKSESSGIKFEKCFDLIEQQPNKGE